MNGRTLLQIVAGLAMAGLSWACQVADRAGEIPTFEVAPEATFVRPVKAEGMLEAVEATPLTAPVDSERPMKIAWVAKDGSHVRKGDVVVRFDDTEAIRQKQDSADDVAAARREIGKVSVASGATRNKREVTAGLAEFETDVAREFVSDDVEIFSRNEILESTIDVGLAEAKFSHSRNLQGIERTASSHALKLHRIDKARATREVERAEAALTKLEVRAPHDGLVVLARNWRGETTRVGDTVWRGQKIAELPHVAQMQAAVFVLEADAGSLIEGLPAVVTVEAHPEIAHEASVLRVDTLAKPRHHDVPVHYFGVVLELAQTDAATMRIGQRVTVVIRIERADALFVPRQAIFDDDGKAIAYVRGDDGFAPVPVVVGLSSAGRVVVTQGLSAGDTVALADPTAIGLGAPPLGAGAGVKAAKG